MDPDNEVQHEFLPFVQQYKSGRVVRFGSTDTVPAGTDDARTGVSSRDVVINPSSGLWAHLFLPARCHAKLPVVVYYHGGAFAIVSTAQRLTHLYLNSLAADANALVVAAEYRLAPEHPLPAAYVDSWESLEWVASHAAGEGGPDPWIAEDCDMSRVFLVGTSAGGNIAHNMAVRAGTRPFGVAIEGLLVIHPYFHGEAAVGAADEALKSTSGAFWRFVCPGSVGLDDPLSNPFSEAAGGSAAERVLVCVAEEDELRDRGAWYYEGLKASGYGGEVELLESMGFGARLPLHQPACEKAREMQARVVSFIR